MATAPQPVFTGAAGEDVDHFIDRCELYYVTAGLTGSALQEANAVVLREGCRGMARECIQKVPWAHRKDFAVLAQALRDRFQYEEEEEDESAILNRMMNLKQGTKKLDDYIDDGIRLVCDLLQIPTSAGRAVGQWVAEPGNRHWNTDHYAPVEAGGEVQY